MSLVNLVGHQVISYSFVSRLANGTKIGLQTKYSYNVKYAEGSNLCKGELSCELCHKDEPESFSVKLVMSGTFTYKAGSEKAALHVDSFNALFPYAKAYIAMATSAGGIPPVNLPEIDITSQNIYSFEKPTP